MTPPSSPARWKVWEAPVVAGMSTLVLCIVVLAGAAVAVGFLGFLIAVGQAL